MKNVLTDDIAQIELKINKLCVICSGKEEIGLRELKGFIRRHPNLRFVGLVHSEVCFDDCFINPRHPEYNSQLQVGTIRIVSLKIKLSH